MGRKPSAKDKNDQKAKRLERKNEQRKIADLMALVTLANQNNNLAVNCTELLSYKNADFEANMYINRVAELDKKVLEWAIDLTERNMKVLYENCAWGWNKKRKAEEMSDGSAWYLVAKDPSGQPVAFSHFRFDLDFEEPVLYCYELQVEAEGRRRGLGARLLAVLEAVARTAAMSYVRLTALKHNPAATKFFEACGYTIDETSPAPEEAKHYAILSKATTVVPEENPSK